MENNFDKINDGLYVIANSIWTPASSAGGRDANGGYVSSLAESVMGITGALVRIADAIEDLADAVRESATP